jgi:Tfp pilus assembly protein PilF
VNRPVIAKRPLLVLAATSLLVALAVLVWWQHGKDRSETASAQMPRATVPPPIPEIVDSARPAPPVIFVGLDGGDWQLLDRYMADGLMPNLAALVEEGAGGELMTQHPPLSPLVWTTMMTGRHALDHGILDFTRYNPVTGATEPITSDERLEPAIWNMATWAGRRVVTLGLWATYPAEAVDGLLVSDRMFTFLFKEDEPPPGIVYPPEAEEAAREVLREAEEEIGLSELQAYLPWLSEEEYARYRDTADPYDHPVSGLRRILVETRVYHTLGVEAIRRDRPDLAIVYFQGTDSIGHVFAPYAPPYQPGVSREDFERYHQVPRKYFQYIDALLGEYRELATETGAVLMLASDHGFFWGEGRPTSLSSHDKGTAAKWHRKEGMYQLWGPGIEAAPGHGFSGGVAQVCATLLELMGLPPGTGLAEPPLPPVPEGPGPKMDYLSHYQRTQAVVGSAVADAAALEKLRALGYIEEDDPGTAPEAVRRSGSTRTHGSYNNEGVILKATDRDRAMAAFEKALKIDPDVASVNWNLSDLLYADESQWDRSDDLLVRAFANGLPRGTKFLVGRAIGYQRAGHAQRALRLMENASRARRDVPDVWLFLGRYQVEAGRCEEAAASFLEAVRLTPQDAAAYSSLGLARLCAGNPAGAREALRRSLEIDPGQPRVRALLESM